MNQRKINGAISSFVKYSNNSILTNQPEEGLLIPFNTSFGLSFTSFLCFGLFDWYVKFGQPPTKTQYDLYVDWSDYGNYFK